MRKFVVFTYGQMSSMDKYRQKFHTGGTLSVKTPRNVVILHKGASLPTAKTVYVDIVGYIY